MCDRFSWCISFSRWQKVECSFLWCTAVKSSESDVVLCVLLLQHENCSSLSALLSESASHWVSVSHSLLWNLRQIFWVLYCPVWARGRCRISPPHFLAECCKRQLNQGSFVLLYFRLSTFSDLYWVCLSVFSCTVCLSVSVKWLAVKTASEMTYTVSSGALNSTPTNHCPAGRHIEHRRPSICWANDSTFSVAV